MLARNKFHFLKLSSSNYSCEFLKSGPNKFSIIFLIFKFRKQPLDNRSLGKASIIHCKIACRFGFDFAPTTEGSAVELNSTLGR